MKVPLKRENKFVYRFNTVFYPRDIIEKIARELGVKTVKHGDFVLVESEDEEKIWKIAERILREVIS